jgi:prefoldin subunit 5
MIGELSYDLNRAKERVKSLQEERRSILALLQEQLNALDRARLELDEAEHELEVLEGIDETLRQARDGVNQAYDAWYNWHKS